VPLLCVSLGIAVWAGARRKPFRPRFATAAAQYLAVFAAIETIEHLAAGWTLGHLLSEPALWLGMATQVVVAGVVALVLRATAHVGEKLVGEPGHGQPPRVQQHPRPALASVSGIALTTISLRGPPLCCGL
jgi:hypothetical protein